MRNRKKNGPFVALWILSLMLTTALAGTAFADSIVHAPQFTAGGITEGEYSARVTDTRLGSVTDQEEETVSEEDDSSVIEGPSAPEGYLLDGRDCFFANGTPITILPSDASVSGAVHDTEVQDALLNDLGPDQPGTGAMITWKEGSEKRYVLVSNLAQVYGGAYQKTLISDTSITVRGEDIATDYPRLFLLIGGSLNADLTGDVRISLEESQILHVAGGGYNGNVDGNVEITAEGRNWSMNMIGGGVAQSEKHHVEATVDGDVTMSLQGSSWSVTDCIIGGGCAVAGSSFAATADVTGSVLMDLAGRDVYQVCAGGLAYTEAEEVPAKANVQGNTTLRMDGLLRSEYPAEDAGYDPWPGIITGYGMTHYGEANVKGTVEVDAEEVTGDETALGLYEEPIVESKATEAAKEAEEAALAKIYNDDTDAITDMQNALNAAGYICGEPDGSLGPQTLEAMQAFQEDHGLPVTTDVLGSLLMELGVL